ncbi:MAG: hypothetical protein LC130_28040 [Bryobacterales bacterium]|nr:hypothetical protein [Bryobacterales bacterium]
MKKIRVLLYSSVLALVLLFSISVSGQTIVVDPARTYQTIVGWEGVAQACHREDEKCVNFDTFKDALFDAIVEMGINRVRLEVHAVEGKCPSGWNLDLLDEDINDVVLPLRQRLMARGEALWVNLNYVDTADCYGSGGGSQPMPHYAAQLVRTYDHLRNRYGFLPDSWEVVLEPGVVSRYWRDIDVGQATIAGYNALEAAGYKGVYVIGPSTPSGGQAALQAFDSILAATPKAIAKWKEFSYHRYHTTDPYLSEIKARAQKHNLGAAMLEHGGSSYVDLHNDLKHADVVAWEQYALAFADLGDRQYEHYSYFDIPGGYNGTTFAIDEYAKFLRQYFKWIRRGAVRIEAAGSAAFDPVAFRNANGTYVVVVKASQGGAFSVEGLPAGSYGIRYTTNSQYDQAQPDETIVSGQSISASIPAEGVLTIYGLSASNEPQEEGRRRSSSEKRIPGTNRRAR